MGRLTTVKPGLSVAPSNLVPSNLTSRERDGRRNSNAHWRKWYGLKRWKDLRWEILTRDLFTCHLCGHTEHDTSQLVCDHVEPHRGNPQLFWSGPFQTLCEACHSIHKQSQESGVIAQSHPDWLRPSVIPVTIICGPPASGKSTYAKQHAGPYDLIIDLDEIIRVISGGKALHDWDVNRWLNPAMLKRNAILSHLSRRPRYRAAWFIVGEPTGQKRQWWSDRLKPVEVVVLLASADQCLAQASIDQDSRDLNRLKGVVADWWSTYTPRAADRAISR